MNINLHHLELFYYVAEAEGISQAVKIIPYSIQQPAISQQMISLEKHLKVRLFERRPFSLTEAGQILFNTIAPFMEELSTLEDDLQGFSRQKLKLACSHLISDSYLPQILPKLMERFPELLPHVFDLEAYDAYKKLLGRELDIVISIEKEPRSRNIKTISLIKLPQTVVLPKSHPLANDFQWTNKALRYERWIALNEQRGAMRPLNDKLSEINLSPSYGAITSSTNSALNYIAIGLGLGFMISPPKFLLEKHNLVALPVLDCEDIELKLSYLPNESQQDVLDAFIDEAISLAKKRQKDFL